MNPKILVAFAGGLVLASGITYIAMRSPAAPEAVVQAAPPPPEPVLVTVTETPVKAEPESIVGEPEPVRAKPLPVAEDRRRVAVRTPLVAPRSVAPPLMEVAKPAPPAAAPVEIARAPEPAPPTPEPPPAPHIDPPPPPRPHTVTIPLGTLLYVRLNEALSTERCRTGDSFGATLEQPLVADGFVIAERGSRVQGRVVESDPSGRVRGLAKLQIEITQINTADGQRVRVNTAAFQRLADSTKAKDAAKVGIGAAIGAAIGGIAGGGKGAGVGAGVGGAAGAGDVLLTRGKPAEIPVETKLSFRLSEALTLTEKLK